MDEKHEEWLAIRKRTFIAFCIMCFGLGFEYSLIFPSLFYYMSKVIKTDKPELYYGIALSAYPAASIIGAFTIARYADYSKRTRLVLLLLLVCEIVGNLLYSLYFSPLCPVFGRLIAGLGDVANMVMVGEVSRSYETHEITSKISWMVMCFSIGFTLSPGMNILFKLFDFYIGPVHMVYANMPGLFMAICFTVVLILACFMVSDISREYDLKATNEEAKLYGKEEMGLIKESKVDISLALNGSYGDYVAKGNDDGGINVSSTDDDESTKLLKVDKEKKKNIENGRRWNGKKRRFHVLRSILSSFDLVLLLVFGFVCSYTLFGFDTLMSLVTSKYFHFGVSRTSIIFIIDGVLYGLVLLAIGKVAHSYSDFHIIIFAVIVQLIGMVAILCISLYHTNIYFNYVCLVVYILAFSTTWSIEEVLTRSLFGKLVPSSCQSYAEGIRRSVSSVAFIIAGISTAGLFKYLAYIFSILIVLTMVLLTVFFYRKDSLTNPTPQFYIDKEEEEKKALL